MNSTLTGALAHARQAEMLRNAEAARLARRIKKAVAVELPTQRKAT